MNLKELHAKSGLNKADFCNVIGVHSQNYAFYIKVNKKSHRNLITKYIEKKAEMIHQVFLTTNIFDLDKKDNLNSDQNYLLAIISKYLQAKKQKYFTVRKFYEETRPYLKFANEKHTTRITLNHHIRTLLLKGYLDKKEIKNKERECFVV